MNNITYAVSVDVNNPIIPYNVYVANVLDSNVRYLEITLYQNGNVITLSNTATATASLVTDNVLVDDSVECTISNNIITVPLEDLQRHGNLDVQVTVTEGEKVLAIPFPIQVRVTPNIAEEAQIDENSMGSYAEVVQEIAEARKGHDSLDERLNSDKTSCEIVMNKVQSISSMSQTFDNNKYPSVTAVRDFVNIRNEDLQDYIEGELDGLDEAKADKTDTNAQFERLIAVLQRKADSAETLAGYGINDAYTKAEVDALENNKENISNKLSSEAGIDENSTDNEYPSAKAVYDYGTTITNNIEDVKAYIGYTDGDILGLHADFENNQFTRLGAAVGLTAGQDFNVFPMYGGRRRCNVAADGTINAYYGDEGYTEDGTNGQVMVYQPAFYYKVVPLELEKNTVSGIGNHLRKANYYVSSKLVFGFKRHPLFYDEQGNPVDYVLFSAYEGSMYDVSEEAYVNDSVDTSVSYGAGDLLCSVAGKKPISGKLNGIGTKVNFETMANNIGSGWHLNTIKAESANQLLMLIELGRFNTQAAIGQGVVSCPSNGSYNCSSYTGSTASLGNATGMATETTYESAGTETVNTTNGKLSVTYRGVENPWGNIWKHVNGINIWGDGTMNSGQVFICDDFSFNESKHDGNYQSAGFTVSNGGGYVSAFGYGDEEFDWLFMPSETTGNSSLPVGDNYWCQPNLNGYRIARLGGYWNNGDLSGGFFWGCDYAPGFRAYSVGGRLLYVPTTTV